MVSHLQFFFLVARQASPSAALIVQLMRLVIILECLPPLVQSPVVTIQSLTPQAILKLKFCLRILWQSSRTLTPLMEPTEVFQRFLPWCIKIILASSIHSLIRVAVVPLQMDPMSMQMERMVTSPSRWFHPVLHFLPLVN